LERQRTHGVWTSFEWPILHHHHPPPTPTSTLRAEVPGEVPLPLRRVSASERWALTREAPRGTQPRIVGSWGSSRPMGRSPGTVSSHWSTPWTFRGYSHAPSTTAHCFMVGFFWKVFAQHLQYFAQKFAMSGTKLANFRKNCLSRVDCMSGRDELDSTTSWCPPSTTPTVPSEEGSVAGLRIGIPQEYEDCPGLSTEVKDAWGKVADLLQLEGAHLEKVINLIKSTICN
jgi:hypothetical protein